jgi:hypothetical protein
MSPFAIRQSTYLQKPCACKQVHKIGLFYLFAAILNQINRSVRLAHGHSVLTYVRVKQVTAAQKTVEPTQRLFGLESRRRLKVMISPATVPVWPGRSCTSAWMSLAHLRMGPGGNTRAEHGRMLIQYGRDLLWKYLVASHLDHRRGAPIQHHATAAVVMRQIAGEKPAFVQHLGARARGIQIAREQARPAQRQLPGLAGGQHPHRFIHNLHLKTFHRPADGLVMFRRFGNVLNGQAHFDNAVALQRRKNRSLSNCIQRLNGETGKNFVFTAA